MEYKQIQELIKAVNKSNIGRLKIKDGEFEIVIEQQQNAEAQVLAYAAAPQMIPQLTQLQQNLAAAPATQQQVSPQSQIPQEAFKPVQNTETGTSNNTITIKSPMIGTFYRSQSPEKPPFVNVGDEINSGTVVCIIEAMKLFNEIESEISGKIIKVLVDDATPVEYDQPLFLVEPK